MEKKEREFEEYIKRIENKKVKILYEGKGRTIDTVEIIGPDVSIKAALSFLIKEVAKLSGVTADKLIVELYSAQIMDDISKQISKESKESKEEDFDTMLERIMKDL